jgi:hypothetical protein
MKAARKWSRVSWRPTYVNATEAGLARDVFLLKAALVLGLLVSTRVGNLNDWPRKPSRDARGRPDH